MNFQQLRIIRETVRQHYNLTSVAHALHTSQSGVSKHIKEMEEELGLDLFVRRGKRFLGLTPPGEALLEIVERMLLDAGNMRRLAEQFTLEDAGQLTIATTHTQARYALPSVVAAFRSAYPRVHLVLLQASPRELVQWLRAGEADIGIATEAVGNADELVTFPYYSWSHSVIAPPDHPLHQAPLTLERLARHPIVTYHHGVTGRSQIDRVFAQAGLTPDIVMAALDADVIKTYVELGMAVGIVASMAVDPRRDQAVRIVAGEPLFGQQTTRIAVRRGHYLRGYAYRFIELCAATLTEEKVRSALSPTLQESLT
jgi:LysR family cys regulon transcriptional activator